MRFARARAHGVMQPALQQKPGATRAMVDGLVRCENPLSLA